MTSGPTRPPGSLRFIPGPELLGALVSVLVVAVVLLVAGSPGGNGSRPGGNTSAPTTGVVAPPASPDLDVAMLDLLRVINQRLLQQRDELNSELAREPFRQDQSAAIIRGLSETSRLGSDAISRLLGPDGDPRLDPLAAFYDRLEEEAAATFQAAAADPAAYRTGAARIVAILAELPARQAELEGLFPGSAEPPSPTPLITPGPPGETGEQIRNGGFEDGVGAPWRLELASGATADLEADPALPFAGTTAARVEVKEATAARSAIVVRQGGIVLEAGRRYVVELASRASANREVLITVASRSGATFVTRIANATVSWGVHSFVFTAQRDDEGAVLEIAVGRSAETLWIDAVSVRFAGTAP